MMELVLNISLQYHFWIWHDNVQEAGNDFVFFNMFLPGDAFFFTLPFIMDSTTVSRRSL
jgi:hypothetical protein